MCSDCTSIVAVNKHGQVLHGRNLDFGDSPFLRELTAVVDFQRNSKVFSYFVRQPFAIFHLLNGRLSGTTRRDRSFVTGWIHGWSLSHLTMFVVLTDSKNAKLTLQYPSIALQFNHKLRIPSLVHCYYSM